MEQTLMNPLQLVDWAWDVECSRICVNLGNEECAIDEARHRYWLYDVAAMDAQQ